MHRVSKTADCFSNVPSRIDSSDIREFRIRSTVSKRSRSTCLANPFGVCRREAKRNYHRVLERVGEKSGGERDRNGGIKRRRKGKRIRGTGKRDTVRARKSLGARCSRGPRRWFLVRTDPFRRSVKRVGRNSPRPLAPPPPPPPLPRNAARRHKKEGIPTGKGTGVKKEGDRNRAREKGELIVFATVKERELSPLFATLHSSR